MTAALLESQALHSNRFETEPKIVSTPDVCGGKPRIRGSRIRVADIFIWHELQGRSVDEIVASFPQLTHTEVYSALAYFFEHSEEIRNQISEDEGEVENLKLNTGSGPLAQKLAALTPHAPHNSIPS